MPVFAEVAHQVFVIIVCKAKSVLYFFKVLSPFRYKGRSMGIFQIKDLNLHNQSKN